MDTLATRAPRPLTVAWVVYVLTVLAVVVIALLTGFLLAHSARPGGAPGSIAVGPVLVPLVGAVLNAVAAAVGIVVLRDRRSVPLVPLVTAFVTSTALVVGVALT